MVTRRAHAIPSRVVPSVVPDPASPRQVSTEFRRALDAGAVIVPAGRARRRPLGLLEAGYVPRARFRLFDASYFITAPRQNDDIRFFVAYVELHGARARRLYPRIFYKDVSLTWRSASHYTRSAHENWIGKGDVRYVVEDGHRYVVSDEVTCDLPLEIQSALEALLRRAKRIPHDEAATELILRHAPDHRIRPYRDFTGPRERARENPRNLVNRGRSIARFTRRGDPTSLVIAAGYEPDFSDGIVERAESKSRLYGGRLSRFRIVSQNRRVQYLFMAGPRQAWIASCQATTTEIMSYGVRTIDAHIDEDVLIPGYEYHFIDDSEDPPTLHSQIPEGFAGPPSALDPSRADASPWLDPMPVMRAFRRDVLRR